MTECPHEDRVLDALMDDGLTGGELASHVESCEACRHLVVIARTLREDHDYLCRDARLPTAGLVWWRATIRARAEAACVVEQPMTIAQGLGGAVVAGLACALASFVWHAVRPLPEPSSLGLLVLGVAVCLVLAPLALVLALVRD